MCERYPQSRRNRGAKSAGSRRRPALQEQDLRDRREGRGRGRLSPQPGKAPRCPARLKPLELLRAVKSDGALRGVRTVGFLSHVQGDLALAAREAGCDRVMARSAFVENLPGVLSGDD